MGSAYRIGGTGSWSDATKWSTVSGGSNDRGVPAASDDVFVDASSGGGTLTINGTPVCRSFDSNGFGGTIAGSAAISVGDATAGAGNIAWRWGTGITRTYTGQIALISTSATQQDIVSNGKTFGGRIEINCASNGSYRLADTFNSPAITFQVTKGSFAQNGQSMTVGAWSSANTNVRSVTLDATLTLTSASSSFNQSQAANLTWLATGSSIILGGGSALSVFSGGGLSYNNVTITTASAAVAAINGTNTFANLTLNGHASTLATFGFGGNQTVTGTLTIAGNSLVNRVLISSSANGTQRTITANSVSASYANFRDILGSGAASWDLSAITGLSGDAGGNSGITFTASVTQTWSGTGGGNWSANSWTTRIPLPQDDVVVNAAFSASQTISCDMRYMGRNIDFTGTTGSPTLTQTSRFCGSLTLATGLGTCTGFGVQPSGSGVFAITTAGKTVGTFAVAGGSSTISLLDALTCGAIAVSSAPHSTFVSNGYSITCTSVTFGDLNVDLTGSTITSTVEWNAMTGTLTMTNATLVLSVAGAYTFRGNGKTFGTIEVVSGTTVNWQQSCTAVSVSRNGATACTINVTAGVTITLTGGASAIGAGTSGNLITWQSSSAGSAFTVSSATTLSTDYISLKDCTGAGAGIPHYAGDNSTNVSGNTNWTFTAPPTFRAAWAVRRRQTIGGGVI